MINVREVVKEIFGMVSPNQEEQPLFCRFLNDLKTDGQTKGKGKY